MTIEQKLQRYAELKGQEKDLDTELKELNSEIVAFMEDQEGTTIEMKFGKFTTYPTTTYKYSDNVKAVEKTLKELKEDEEAKGIAEATVKTSLRFTPPKV